MIVRMTAGLVFSSAVVWSLMGLFSPRTIGGDGCSACRRIPKVGGPLAELWRAGWLYRRKKTAVAIALGMTLVGHCGWVFIFHLCVSSFPEVDSATFPEHVLIVPVGMTAQALFPLPGGVGGGEAAYGWLYTLLGKAAIGGILGCLVQRVVAWGIGFIGYVVYTRMPKEGIGCDRVGSRAIVAATTYSHESSATAHHARRRRRHRAGDRRQRLAATRRDCPGRSSSATRSGSNAAVGLVGLEGDRAVR